MQQVQRAAAAMEQNASRLKCLGLWVAVIYMKGETSFEKHTDALTASMVPGHTVEAASPPA